MNVLLILAALRPRLSSPLALITRVFAAIGLFSIELQLATWSGLATIRTLAIVNACAAAAAVALALMRSRATEALRVFVPPPVDSRSEPDDRRGAFMVAAAVVALAAVAGGLAAALPLEAADPYHLQRVEQIDRLGTLAYDLVQSPKVNGIGWIYEAVLADLRQIPVAGPLLLRLHGIAGLMLYVLALAAVRAWLPAARDWPWVAALVVPAVFHQLVLVKNDLFGAIPALLALAWVVARGDRAERREIVWASWLAGFAVAVKLTSFPVALVLPAAVLLLQRDRPAGLGLVALGGLLGVVCGGLAFTLVENARWYGSPMYPFAAGGAADNRNATVADAALSIGRFAISLFDLGLVTRTSWPGRGGWGSTFGLPLVWAFAVLGARYRESPEARRALWTAAACFVLFAAVYTDADLAHRMVLAPGVLLLVVAIHLVGDSSTWLRRALVPVVVLSAAQIIRSAVLYLTRAV
jgi:hypothetical protein